MGLGADDVAGKEFSRTLQDAEKLSYMELEAAVVGLRQQLDASLMSASLKPVYRKKLDELGKKAATEKKAAAQARGPCSSSYHRHF